MQSCASTGLGKTVVAPKILDPDSKLTQLCNLPADIGSKALTQGQVENLWSKDRANLVLCYKKHKGLVDFTLNQNKLLRGK